MHRERISCRNIRMPDHWITLYLAFILLLLTVPLGCAEIPHLTSCNISGTQTQALICKPLSPGSFPTVVYNHGRIVGEIGYEKASSRGYRLDRICRASAADGFLVFVPIRRSGPRNILRHKEEVNRALDYVKGLPEVDASRIGLMGF